MQAGVIAVGTSITCRCYDANFDVVAEEIWMDEKMSGYVSDFVLKGVTIQLHGSGTRNM